MPGMAKFLVIFYLAVHVQEPAGYPDEWASHDHMRWYVGESLFSAGPNLPAKIEIPFLVDSWKFSDVGLHHRANIPQKNNVLEV